MHRVKVGVVGAGSHANNVHFPSLNSIETAEVVAVCDINRERLSDTAQRHGITRLYLNHLDMIEKEELEAVYVIMPPHQMYDVVVDCLKEGLHVFIEKPPGVSSHQTRSLAWLAEKHGCRTMVGFNRRYIPLMRQVREAVEKRGPINQCVAVFYKNQTSEEPPYYRGAVDILTSDMIHAVDALRWMGGNPRSVASSVRRLFADYYNSFNALVHFEQGAIGFLMGNWVAGSRMHTFEMHSKSISAFINPNDRATMYADDQPEPSVITTYAAAGGSKDFHVYYGFLDENKHFIERISRDEEPDTNFRDAVKTMELVDLIYRNSIT